MATFNNAYDYVVNSGMSFDEYIKFVKNIEPGSDVYIALKAAYDAKDATGFNQILDYQTVRESLDYMEKNNADMKKYIDKVNRKWKDYPQVQQAISDWLSDDKLEYTYTYKGEIINILYNRSNHGVTSIVPGGNYWDGINVRTAMTADVVDGKLVISDELPVGETGTTTTALVGQVTSAIGAIATMSAFAKEVRGDFYTLAQDVWGVDLYMYDPDWWDARYAGDLTTGFRAFIANNLLSVNPTTNEFAMYIEDDFAVKIATYANSKGWFDVLDDTYTVDSSEVSHSGLNYPIHAYDKVETLIRYDVSSDPLPYKVATASSIQVNASGKLIVVKAEYGVNTYAYNLIYASKTNDITLPNSIQLDTATYSSLNPIVDYDSVQDYYDANSTVERTVNGKPVWLTKIAAISFTAPNAFHDLINDWDELYVRQDRTDFDLSKNIYIARAGYIALYGDVSPKTIRGLYEQGDAKHFATTNKNIDFDNMKLLLQANYPELWTNSIIQGVAQPDGSIIKKTYINVPIPEGTDLTSPNPTTGAGTQNKKKTNINDLPKGSQSTLTNTAAKPSGSTKTPDKTDTGTAPSSPLPVGKASSMWAIYNPSQAEVDSFGSWMWSSNIFEQIKKLFADPMQAIIGIHKVFGTPIVGGRKSIKVGYLDSNIPSNYVTNQYVTVDCGKVGLAEYFNCVYDYAPFTSVNLYLPFVGVVQLETADVMRSTIGVTYGIDVLTGDCLAKVSVERDGVGGILYSFPGNCAVKYPVSSGSYLGILGFAAGAVGAFATGNPGLLAAGASGGFFNVKHSGSFAGNTGATGPKTPYLIVSRPQPEFADNFNSIEGYPVNFSIQIGQCRGFIRVKECHLSGINATDDELDMIDQILRDGIIVQS